MDNEIYYTIFRTPWGWFGILGCKNGLIRTCLPMTSQKTVQRHLLSGTRGAIPAKNACRSLEKDILSYYKGHRIDFSNVPVCIAGLTEFQQRILTILRTVRYGNTISYSDLAKLAGHPKAARAIGTALAKNLLPLIIPCHRVICCDGSLGGFSGAGGVLMKKRMLTLEKSSK